MQIICNESDLIVNITDGAVKDDYGNVVAEGVVMIGNLKVFSVDTLPADILPMKYCYTEIKGFFLNANYVPTIDEQLKESSERLALCEQALLDMMGV